MNVGPNPLNGLQALLFSNLLIQVFLTSLLVIGESEIACFLMCLVLKSEDKCERIEFDNSTGDLNLL